MGEGEYMRMYQIRHEAMIVAGHEKRNDTHFASISP